MGEDENDHGDEVSGVDRGVAVFHEESAYEEAESRQVADIAEDLVEAFKLVRLPARVMVVGLGDAGVYHDAERHEHRVLGEEKNQEET